MGTDIHMVIQKRQGDYNNELTPWKTVESHDMSRCYDAFSILADVRNGYGFAGCPTGEGFVPISKPKGFPVGYIPSELDDEDDATGTWLGDHSYSWLTLKELLDYDWTQTTTKYGVINEEQYAQWRRWKYPPNSYSGSVSGGNTAMVSNEELDAILDGKATRKKNAEYFTRVKWQRSYFEAGADIWDVIAKMLKLAEGDYTSVRIVFGFDS